MPTLESLISEEDRKKILAAPYNKDIEEILQDKEYQDIMCKNYPHLTRTEIKKQLKAQQKIKMHFHHQHDEVTEQVIKRFFLLKEERDEAPPKRIENNRTIETNETHSCNCVKISPELQ